MSFDSVSKPFLWLFATLFEIGKLVIEGGPILPAALFLLGSGAALIASFFCAPEVHCLLLSGGLFLGAILCLMSPSFIGSILVGTLVVITVYSPESLPREGKQAGQVTARDFKAAPH